MLAHRWTAKAAELNNTMRRNGKKILVAIHTSTVHHIIFMCGTKYNTYTWVTNNVHLKWNTRNKERKKKKKTDIVAFYVWEKECLLMDSKRFWFDFLLMTMAMWDYERPCYFIRRLHVDACMMYVYVQYAPDTNYSSQYNKYFVYFIFRQFFITLYFSCCSELLFSA